MKQVKICCGHLRCDLIERADVVQNPKRTALGRDQQIFLLHLDIGDRHVRQIQLKRLPMRAIVERNKHAEFRSGIKQSFAVRIFAHHACGPVGRNPVLSIRQSFPTLSIIIRAIQVRLVITQKPTVHGVVSRALAMRRRLDVLDPASRRKSLWRDVGPRFSVIARKVEGAVICARPDYALFQRGFRNRIKRAVELFASDIAGYRLAARALATGRLGS